MQLKKTKIPGCFQIEPRIHHDERGAFIKIFHKDIFLKYGLDINFAEEYYSVSYKGVLRGMHFQTPPMDHIKVVHCVSGEVLDAVIDLRKGSPMYGRFEMFNLNSKEGNMIYIPAGLAHGFYVVSDIAILMYKVTTVYSPKNDSGIRWNTLGIPWPNDNPIMSQRDSALVEFCNFVSPFIY
jgi:dTDP-4-dehydrorhamnose 3,5-epimerase